MGATSHNRSTSPKEIPKRGAGGRDVYVYNYIYIYIYIYTYTYIYIYIYIYREREINETHLSICGVEEWKRGSWPRVPRKEAREVCGGAASGGWRKLAHAQSGGSAQNAGCQLPGALARIGMDCWAQHPTPLRLREGKKRGGSDAWPTAPKLEGRTKSVHCAC